MDTHHIRQNTFLYSINKFKWLWIGLIILLGGLLAEPAEAQRMRKQERKAYRKQSRKIKRACAIFARRNYVAYRKSLAAMRRKPKPKAEEGLPRWLITKNHRARKAAFNEPQWASVQSDMNPRR